MLKIIGIIIAALIAGVLVLAATKPDSFRVERTTTIQAAPDAIFPLINDFHRWGAWSPYEKKDPAMQRSYAGAESSVGAIYSWDGNKDIGAGRMEIIEATVPTRVVIRLEFLRPFTATNTAEFTLTPGSNGTEVSWVMHGPASFVSKIMQVFFNMDRMIGTDFEAGLAALKSAAET